MSSEKITLEKLRTKVKLKSSLKRAKVLMRFFKTGKGDYGEGDVFIGLTVPESRKIAHSYKDLRLFQLKLLLRSKIHEERLIALLILVDKFQKGDSDSQEEIYHFYLKHTKFINNWDLIDLTADKIVGSFLLNKPKELLFKLAKSKILWERRMAIIATFCFIKERKEYEYTFRIAEVLINDSHELIHKAVGWMLREVGKRISEKTEEDFLHKYCKIMPRIMLRYAVERFPEEKRQKYLNKSKITHKTAKKP